jgi:hypothetical protein
VEPKPQEANQVNLLEAATKLQAPELKQPTFPTGINLFADLDSINF